MQNVLANRDILSNVLEYLYLDDWCHLRILGREMCSSIMTRLKSIITRIVQDRMLRLLTQCFESAELVNAFLFCLAKSKGVISGSVFLQLLLGPSVFAANDFDIYVPLIEKDMFSPLHDFVFAWSEGLPWNDEENPASRCAGLQKKHRQFRTGQLAEFTQTSSYVQLRRQLFKEAELYSVHNYEAVPILRTRNIKFQIVTLETNYHVQTDYVHTIAQYIRAAFDFECCMSMMCVHYLGTDSDAKHHFKGEVSLPKLSQIWLRELVISPKRQRLMFLF